MSKPFTPKTTSITGTFDKQRWTGPKEDRAESIGEVEFDATFVILQMPLKKIKQLEDCNESSDRIGQELVPHDGPCSVYIESGVCGFFGVSKLGEITPAMFAAAKQWFFNLPTKPYVARLKFVTYVDVPVQARHPSEVNSLAIQTANSALSKQSHNVEVAEYREV